MFNSVGKCSSHCQTSRPENVQEKRFPADARFVATTWQHLTGWLWEQYTIKKSQNIRDPIRRHLLYICHGCLSFLHFLWWCFRCVNPMCTPGLVLSSTFFLKSNLIDRYSVSDCLKSIHRPWFSQNVDTRSQGRQGTFTMSS